MNRFDRITAILIQLQSKKVVKAQDLADRFGISLRTVYRDIRSLEEAGVPLFGEAGVGYSLVDGYRLPPVMFTPKEAMAFVTAEKLMERFSDGSLGEKFTEALYKVKAVLRTAEKDMVENLGEVIQVTSGKYTENTSTNALDVLLKAIADKKAIELEYKAFGNNTSSNRLIEPIGVFHENDFWYTIGYCHLRDDYRQFRLDRMLSVKVSDIDQKERETFKEYRMREKVFETLNLEKAIILVDNEVVPFIQGRRHYYGFISETAKGNKAEMTFMTCSLEEGFARWILMFGDYVDIVEPESLKHRLAALMEKIADRLKLTKIEV